MTQPVASGTQATTYRYSEDLDKLIVSAPVDRIRWASVLGGLFAALAAIIFFTVLGIAVGFSTFDANNVQAFGVGAGVYGMLAFTAAFALGGFLAARTAAVAGPGNGLLNGGMVWIVALPIIVNVLGAGVGTLLGVATSAVGTVADTAVSIAAPLVAENADDIANAAATVAPTVVQAAQAVGTAVESTAEATSEIVDPAQAVVATAQGVATQVSEAVANVDPEDINEASRDLSGPAWAALAALGLSALAALLGGWAGARTTPTDVAIINR